MITEESRHQQVTHKTLENVLLLYYFRIKGFIRTHPGFSWWQRIRTGFFVLSSWLWALGFSPAFLAHLSWATCHLRPTGSVSPAWSPSRFLSLFSSCPDSCPWFCWPLSPYRVACPHCDSAWVERAHWGPTARAICYFGLCVLVSVSQSHLHCFTKTI